MGPRHIEEKQEQSSREFTVIRENISEVIDPPVRCIHTKKNMHITSSASPEQARHGVPGSVVQRSVVLVGFAVGGVGIQSISELLVALIQLAG